MQIVPDTMIAANLKKKIESDSAIGRKVDRKKRLTASFDLGVERCETASETTKSDANVKCGGALDWPIQRRNTLPR